MPRSLAEHIAEHATRNPDGLAYASASEQMTWAEYDARSTAVAAHWLDRGAQAGQRIAVLLPDGPGVHAALVGCEKAGLVAVGIGPRAGYKEIEHLLRKTGATGLMSRKFHEGRDLGAFARELGLRHHLPVEDELSALAANDSGTRPASGLASRDVFLLNSTSGTTGMPKVVVHDQDRWYAFHELAVATGKLSGQDVFMSAVSAPFGFGIWTSHVTPTLLGAPTIVTPRFSPEETLALIERHRVTVLAAVSTQFVMLLESPEMQRCDLSSLRVLYTGGEVVPSARAAEFEDRTGAAVLQFYGSNETGALCGTSLRDDREHRLKSSGRLIPEMNVRLFDERGEDVTESGRGQPGCKGPTLSRGYWQDEAENRKLVRPDGWMLLGDIVSVDADGYLRVIGRTDDFIIRGGKNISGPAVEQEVAAHPAVALAAAVTMPDPVFGERVCVYVELRPGATLTLVDLNEEMRGRQVSKENLPERLQIVEALPRGSGGKVAKQKLREDIRRRLEAEGSSGSAPA